MPARFSRAPERATSPPDAERLAELEAAVDRLARIAHREALILAHLAGVAGLEPAPAPERPMLRLVRAGTGGSR
jgi:hypothetical protein